MTASASFSEEKDRLELLPPCEDIGRMLPLASQEEALAWNQIDILILDFPASKTMRNTCLLLKLPSLC